MATGEPEKVAPPTSVFMSVVSTLQAVPAAP